MAARMSTRKERVVAQDLVKRRPVGEEFKHVGNPQPLPADARPAAALPRLHGDSSQKITVHGNSAAQPHQQSELPHPPALASPRVW